MSSEHFNGEDSFSYIALDDSDTSSVAIVSLTVTAKDDFLEVTDIPDQTIDEGLEFEMFDLDDYLIEYDGDAVIWTVTGELELIVTIDEYNLVTILPPTEIWNGSEQLTFTATDITENSYFDTDVSVFTVNPINNVPIAYNDYYTTDEDVLLTSNVLLNDIDIDEDILTVELVDSVLHGNLILNDDGTFEYTPFVAFSGIDSFSYVANDGEVNSEVAYVTITVFAVNYVIKTAPNPATSGDDILIEYSIPSDNSNEVIKILVIDSSGKTVKVIDGNNSVGQHQEWWNGRNDDGFSISQGLYIILLKSDEKIKASWIMASK